MFNLTQLSIKKNSKYKKKIPTEFNFRTSRPKSAKFLHQLFLTCLENYQVLILDIYDIASKASQSTHSGRHSLTTVYSSMLNHGIAMVNALCTVSRDRGAA